MLLFFAYVRCGSFGFCLCKIEQGTGNAMRKRSVKIVSELSGKSCGRGFKPTTKCTVITLHVLLLIPFRFYCIFVLFGFISFHFISLHFKLLSCVFHFIPFVFWFFPLLSVFRYALKFIQHWKLEPWTLKRAEHTLHSQYPLSLSAPSTDPIWSM